MIAANQDEGKRVEDFPLQNLSRWLVCGEMLGYVHVPFCHRVCPYCSFYKHTPGGISVGGFVEAVLRESTRRVSELPEKPRTLFLGGGTPSMLSPSLLKKLFVGLDQSMSLDSMDEVSMEANPATFDEAKAKVFLACGVRRISLGIQSFSEKMLTVLGREHDPEQAAESVRLLRRAGMPSINIDLMFSLPNQTMDDWRETLQIAISLEPDHLSAYNLTYEEDTAFFDSFQDGKMRQSEELNEAMFYEAHEMLERAGYRHYETSNYARPSHESIHNQGYWAGEDYLGLGPSAVSTVHGERSRNIADTANYIRMINGIGHAIEDVEVLSDEARRLEKIAMGLRTQEGIARAWLDDKGMARMQVLIEEEFAAIKGEYYILTKKGSALVDAIAAEVI